MIKNTTSGYWLTVTDDFLSICNEIVTANLPWNGWSEIESDDMFQRGPYVGGFDAIEQAFCFSYFERDRTEFWFQLTLEELAEVVSGNIKVLEVRPAQS